MERQTLTPQIHEEEGIKHAHARVQTPKASRYLKALCNHFSRKVTASYDDENGRVEFPFGDCTFHAEPDVLLISVSAASNGLLAQVKDVVADHLIRFSQEECEVNWIDGV